MAETTDDDPRLTGTHGTSARAPIRPDGVDKVTGRARFGADFNLPGQLIGRVLRSPHPHARIISIDTSKAEALPGVKAVITRDDFADQPLGVHPGRRDDDQLQGRGAERHGAREGALRGPRRGRGGRDQRRDRQARAQADRGRSTRCCRT